MAKALNKKQPESSIDRFLDKSLAQELLEPQEEYELELPQERTPERTKEKGRVVGEIQRKVPDPSPDETPKIVRVSPGLPAIEAGEEKHETRLPTLERTGEPATIKREVVLTAQAAKTFDDLVNLFSESTGSDPTRSHIMRALLLSVRESMPELAASAMRLGPMKRPSNARGFEAERDDFERRIADAMLEGLRG